MPCLLWAELHEKLICGSKMMVKSNLHFSATEDLVHLWVNWRLFFWFVDYLFLFYWLILFNSSSTLSSHQILTNLTRNLIFGPVLEFKFGFDSSSIMKSVRFLTFCWVSLTVGQNQEDTRCWYCFLQNLLFQKFSRNTFEFPTGDICSKA